MISPVLRLIAYLLSVSMCWASLILIHVSVHESRTTHFWCACVCVVGVVYGILFITIRSAWNEASERKNERTNERNAYYSGRQRANSCSNMCTITLVHFIFNALVVLFSWQLFLLFIFTNIGFFLFLSVCFVCRRQSFKVREYFLRLSFILKFTIRCHSSVRRNKKKYIDRR